MVICSDSRATLRTHCFFVLRSIARYTSPYVPEPMMSDLAYWYLPLRVIICRTWCGSAWVQFWHSHSIRGVDASLWARHGGGCRCGRLCVRPREKGGGGAAPVWRPVGVARPGHLLVESAWVKGRTLVQKRRTAADYFHSIDQMETCGLEGPSTECQDMNST